MHAVVLAAGEGSRLRPLTATRPKPMIPVGNKPILQYVIRALAVSGVTDVTLVVGYRRERVQSFFEDGKRFGVRIRYVFQDALLGTAHALAQVDVQDEQVLVLGGDNIVDDRLVKDVLQAPGDIVLAAKRAPQPTKYGVLTTKGGHVTSIDEHPAVAGSDLVNTGVYRFSGAFCTYLREQVREGYMGITHVLQRALEDDHRIDVVRSDGLWMDALYPWDLLALNARMVREAPEAPEGAHPSAVIEGPNRIGDDADVGPNAVLQATTTLGNNVVVGAGCVLENCVLLDDVQVGAGSVLRNTILGEGARVGPRTVALAGDAEVRARDGWHRVTEIGSVIGPDAEVGGATTLKPGTLVGHRARLGAGHVVSENVPDGAYCP